ncbi:MAG: universal stress protein [Elainellaceae cyanobacterium]
MSINRILVAVDQSDSQTKIVDQAVDLAQNLHADMLFIHCMTMPPAVASPPAGGVAPIGSGPYPAVGMSPNPAVMGSVDINHQHWDEEVKQTQSWLRGYCETAIAQGVNAEFDCRVGDPNEQICASADTWDADLIVIGRKGKSGLAEIFLGSVSNHVVHHAPCSVLVVQNSK